MVRFSATLLFTFVRSLGTVTYAICYLLSLVRMAAFLHDVGHPPFSHRQVRLLFQRYFVLGK
ncbi:HD domain-containing protein [Clostridiales bacterium]|nr:HD domain-containing protein [Clostridiales bacterium]